MAEGGGLLNRYTLQRRIEGSNPSVSASPINIDKDRSTTGALVGVLAIEMHAATQVGYRPGAIRAAHPPPLFAAFKTRLRLRRQEPWSR